MIAKNDRYGYKSIPDAFQKMVKEDGISGLYKGSKHFLFNYVVSYGIQMVFYETYMDLKKRKYGMKAFKEKENRYVIEAAILGGLMTGVIMNSFECIVYLRIAE